MIDHYHDIANLYNQSMAKSNKTTQVNNCGHLFQIENFESILNLPTPVLKN